MKTENFVFFTFTEESLNNHSTKAKGANFLLTFARQFKRRIGETKDVTIYPMVIGALGYMAVVSYIELFVFFYDEIR